VFIPLGKVSYREAATRIARRVANLGHHERPGPPTSQEHDFLVKCMEDLGRALAGSSIKCWGIVTAPWQDAFGNGYEEGDEVELRPTVWRTLDAKRRMTEPPEKGWLPGEIGYEGGRVLAVLDSKALDEYIALMWPHAKSAAAESATPVLDENDLHPSSPPAMNFDHSARLACMLGYAHAFKLRGHVVKRDEAISAMVKILHCTTRKAEAAYEALPYPELRNPPPVARTAKMSDQIAGTDTR
jgi:hypothetical protein